jgi:DNA-binding transcriptional MerR regulator
MHLYKKETDFNLEPCKEIIRCHEMTTCEQVNQLLQKHLSCLSKLENEATRNTFYELAFCELKSLQKLSKNSMLASNVAMLGKLVVESMKLDQIAFKNNVYGFMIISLFKDSNVKHESALDLVCLKFDACIGAVSERLIISG